MFWLATKAVGGKAEKNKIGTVRTIRIVLLVLVKSMSCIALADATWLAPVFITG
jgi:hypothetical protein